jgi:phosphatidate phosphatase PAH1
MFDFNSATLSGCIDIVVIEHADGSYSSTPFHARFGKLKVFKSEHKVINIVVNGKDTGIKMRLGKSGEAYFLIPKDEAMTKSQKMEHIEEMKQGVAENMQNYSDIGKHFILLIMSQIS